MGLVRGAPQVTEANPGQAQRGMAPCGGTVLGGNKAAPRPASCRTEMDVATRVHVLFFREDCYNSM